ncbi:RNA exonuclease 4 [Aphelenchoides fujianensis]|nr:RNA exonuclease 4 [Aphelenchoides fujianensis]
MAPPNRNASGQDNWKQLKSELSTTTSTKIRQVVASPVKPGKNAKKNAKRRKIFEEAVKTAVVAKTTNGQTTVQTATVATTRVISEVCALDCEYVGVGFQGADDHLARVSIVNEKGVQVYDKYVKPREAVVDYRTHVSGIREGHLQNGLPFSQVQQEVHKLLANKIVVGHALHNDFRVLNLTHPFRLIRDTAKYRPFRNAVGCASSPSLKLLAEKLLGVRIQEGEHDSLIDARTALRLYMNHRKKWDSEVKQVRRK